jgi:hypothetical protein
MEARQSFEAKGRTRRDDLHHPLVSGASTLLSSLLTVRSNEVSSRTTPTDSK